MGGEGPFIQNLVNNTFKYLVILIGDWQDAQQNQTGFFQEIGRKIRQKELYIISEEGGRGVGVGDVFGGFNMSDLLFLECFIRNETSTSQKTVNFVSTFFVFHLLIYFEN